MKNLLSKIRELPHFDKILHFLGSATILFCLYFLGRDIAVLLTLGIGVGIELGDLKHYGWAIIKSKDKKKIKEYLVNTIGDLVVDTFGILIMALLLALLNV